MDLSTSFQLSATAMATVPIVMLLVSGSKTYLDAKYAPLVCLVLSLLASFFFVPVGDITANIVQGVMLTLAASGLYSSGKALASSPKTE